MRRLDLPEIEDSPACPGWVRDAMTDLYPNQSAAPFHANGSELTYHPDPVSALDVPAELAGLRTMFTALHHFSPGEVKEILKNAQEAGVPFAAFEATHRSARGMFITVFVPILVWIFMLQVRPRRVLALVFTYLVPVLPLLIWWDGFASASKTYSVPELAAIAASIRTTDYIWEAEEIAVRGVAIPTTVITGRPVREAP